MLRFSVTSHPGTGYRLVICDLCKKQTRLKDTVLVKDKASTQYGLIICQRHVDEINIGVQKPIVFEPEKTVSPELIRAPQTETYITPDIDDRVPSAPRNLIARGGYDVGTIDLTWEGPEDSGSSGIIGYKVQISNPQYAEFEDVSSNTGVAYTTYTDTNVIIPTEGVTYRVAAINTYGTGAYSAQYHFPTLIAPEYLYLLESQDNDVITTSDGEFIIL